MLRDLMCPGHESCALMIEDGQNHTGRQAKLGCPRTILFYYAKTRRNNRARWKDVLSMTCL